MDINYFLSEANKIHGKLFNYEKSVIKGWHDKIIIICEIHGEFLQTPANHLSNKRGCPRCGHKRGHEKHVKSLSQFIEETIYEFYGDFWHGNPKIYDPNLINKVVKKTFGTLYLNTIERENNIKSAGVNMITIWESDWLFK